MSANGKSTELSPRQKLFKEYYLNPESPTFSNAYKSALEAGYEDTYANKITGESNDWFGEIVRDNERFQKAEKVLDKTLGFIDDEDVQRQKMAVDVSKFVAKGMGKNKYSERTELTGKDGKELPAPIMQVTRADAVQRDDGDK
jgi:hypothetical protein